MGAGVGGFGTALGLGRWSGRTGGTGCGGVWIGVRGGGLGGGWLGTGLRACLNYYYRGGDQYWVVLSGIEIELK